MNQTLSPTSVESLPPITYKGQPVITTEMLAQVYEVEPHQIRQNFKNNRMRFIEGKHFFRISGAELNDLRLRVENFDSQISTKARSLTLWLERGAARHAKMLNTDKAWDVFELLEETFFRTNQPQPLPEPGYLSTPADRRALKALVEYRSARTGMHIEECWADVHQRFGISRVSDLPRHQVRTAEAFVWALLDAPVLIGAHADELARLTRERELGLRRLRDAVPEYIWEEKPAMQGLLDDARELLKIFTYREGLLDRPDWGATPRSWADCPMDAHIDTDVLAAATIYHDIIAETLGSMGVDENRTSLALESFLLGAIPRMISPGRPGEGWSAE